MPRVLNVGGGPVRIDAKYADWDEVRLDIDPAVGPDIVLDALRLGDLDAGQYDAVYSSHSLEHFHEHEVGVVLAGFYHVLTEAGFADIRCPDALAVVKAMSMYDMDLDDVLYVASVGPIRCCDVLWGYQKEIRESGNGYYGHRTGFSRRTLGGALKGAGFEYVLLGAAHWELRALAYKQRPV